MLSWDVLNGAGFLCNETAVSWDTGKGKSCVSVSSEAMRLKTFIEGGAM